jgi:prolyl-tRNA editing enzyme YbaK/EbsC (Cys-tRNA(Pro) deacylase)
MTSEDSLGRVQNFVYSHGFRAKFEVLSPESTRTSDSAAETLGCSVAQIAKTIAFILVNGGQSQSFVVILSGDRRVSLEKLAHSIHASPEQIRKMNADEVKREIGYSIGGVPPFPHKEGVKILADTSLKRFALVWAAAGTSNSVMKIEPRLLSEELKIPFQDISEQL